MLAVPDTEVSRPVAHGVLSVFGCPSVRTVFVCVKSQRVSFAPALLLWGRTALSEPKVCGLLLTLLKFGFLLKYYLFVCFLSKISSNLFIMLS